MKLDPDDDPDAAARATKSLVVPRPIGWISTVDGEGTDNLAPYSYFNAVSNYPPIVMFAAGGQGDWEKDTPRNALDTGEFVVNLVTESVLAAMDETSESTDESEFDAVGLGRLPSETVAPPRVAEASASMECTVVDSLEIGGNMLVFGRVRRMHVAESLCSEGRIDARKVDAVGRLGGPYYTRIDRIDFERGY